MAHGGSQLDYHVLQDLKQRFPEIPEGVVSQYLLQVHAYTRKHAHKLFLCTITINIIMKCFAYLYFNLYSVIRNGL